MYFFPLNTIPVLVCPYWYKKKREIRKTENRKPVITKTLASLGTPTRRQKLPFPMLFQMVIGALGIFPHRFFLKAILWFSDSFLHFPAFLCMVPDSDLGFEFPVEFYIDYSGAHIFFIFFHYGIIEETQDAKMPKIRFSQGGLPLFPQTWVFRNFCIL